MRHETNHFVSENNRVSLKGTLEKKLTAPIGILVRAVEIRNDQKKGIRIGRQYTPSTPGSREFIPALILVGTDIIA